MFSLTSKFLDRFKRKIKYCHLKSSFMVVNKFRSSVTFNLGGLLEATVGIKTTKNERTDLFAFQLKVHVDGVVCVVVCLRGSALQQQMQFLVQPLQTVAQYTGRLLRKD